MEEDILTLAEKVKAAGHFLLNLDPGDLKHSKQEFMDDVGAMLIKTAEEIQKLCNEALKGEN